MDFKKIFTNEKKIFTSKNKNKRKIVKKLDEIGNKYKKRITTNTKL